MTTVTEQEGQQIVLTRLTATFCGAGCAPASIIKGSFPSAHR